MEKQESKNTTMVAAEGIFFITFSYKEQPLSSIEVISCQSTVTSHSLCVCATVHVCVCACTALKGSDPRGLTDKEQSKQSKCHTKKTESASSLSLVAPANIHKHTA